MYEISWGNQYNVPTKVYYIESDLEVSDIPSDALAGSIAIVNEANNFHVLMKDSSDNWNTI